jgi:hypothetical protein
LDWISFPAKWISGKVNGYAMNYLPYGEELIYFIWQ